MREEYIWVNTQSMNWRPVAIAVIVAIFLAQISGFMVGRLIYLDTTPSVNTLANNGWTIIDPQGRVLDEMAVTGDYWTVKADGTDLAIDSDPFASK